MRLGIVHLLFTALLCIGQIVHATPVSSTPVRTFAGNIDFAVTGATLRSNSDAGDSCAADNSSVASLSGVPSGTTIVAAYLYWAGSGSASDYDVFLNGSPVSADTQYTENVGANRDYFSGVANVTGQVSGNGNFTLSGLDIDSADNSCNVSATIAGWGLVVIYERPTEPFRTINFFEGFQNFWGSSITLSPSNFVIPNSGIDGRFAILTWEGDAGNSGTRNGVTENLFFDGQNTANQAQTDGLNPINNQYNSTINVNNTTDSYGVDFDVYDISSRLTAGDTSAQTTYASGQDRVLLSLQIVSVTNTPATDLALSKTHNNNFAQGGTGNFELIASNLGPLTHTGVITVSDPLPTGMTFNSFSSIDVNWSCTGSTTITCTHPGTLAVGGALAPISINVSIANTMIGSFTNTATLSSPLFDPVSGNNIANDTVLVVAPANLSVSKIITTLSDPSGSAQPKNIPGATIHYAISVTNPGPETADTNSVVIADILPPQARLLFALGSQDPIVFVDGATNSGLSYTFTSLDSATDDIEFSNDGGVTSLTPLVDAATGLDITAPRINHISINPKGDLTPTSSPPSFAFELLMQLD